MVFNVTVSISFLIKVFIGFCFFRSSSNRSMRLYLIMRYIVNFCLTLPLLFILRKTTATYVVNYFVAMGLLVLSEMLLLLIYKGELCRKDNIEIVEDIEGTKVTSITRNNKIILVNVKIS
jgi:hypothetical protein